MTILIAITLIIIAVFIMVLLISIGGIEVPENKICPYKGACSSISCPYWKNCHIKE